MGEAMQLVLQALIDLEATEKVGAALRAHRQPHHPSQRQPFPAASTKAGHGELASPSSATAASSSRIRMVAKEGALEALANSRPGAAIQGARPRAGVGPADAARLGEALKEMAVKLMLVEGKGCWG